MGKLFGWLNRSYAETIEAYNTRMNRLPVLHAGYVFFDWANYDADAHAFSVYIEWNGELNQKLQDAMPQGGYAFRCSQEQAAGYVNESNGSPVYVKLYAKCGRLYVKHLYFNNEDKRYELFFNGCDVIPPEMVCFWGRGPVEQLDYSEFLRQETEHEASGGSYRSFSGSYHGRKGSSRSVLGSYRGKGSSYRGLLGSYRVGSYRGIKGSYRSLFGTYHSIFGSYRGIGGSYRSLFGTYHSLFGSYRGIGGSYRSLFGTYHSLFGSYRGMGGSYRSLFGTYHSLFGSYRGMKGSYRSLFGTYHSLFGSYRGMKGSYRSLVGTYHSLFGSYRNLNGSYQKPFGSFRTGSDRGIEDSSRSVSGSGWNDFEQAAYDMNEKMIYFPEEDNMVDGALGYGLDLI